MAYSTQAEIEKAIPQTNLVQLTDDAGSGTVDTAIVTEAITWADDLIDSHLRAKYTVPLSAAPSIIKTISVDLSVFFLYRRRFETELPEGIEERYQKATKLLEKIQRGIIDLGITVGSGDTTGSDWRVNKTANDRQFGQDTWDAF